MDLNRFSNSSFYERHYPGTGDELDPLLNATAEHRRRMKATRWACFFATIFGTIMLFLIVELINSDGDSSPDVPEPMTVNLTSEVLPDPLVGI